MSEKLPAVYLDNVWYGRLGKKKLYNLYDWFRAMCEGDIRIKHSVKEKTYILTRPDDSDEVLRISYRQEETVSWTYSRLTEVRGTKKIKTEFVRNFKSFVENAHFPKFTEFPADDECNECMQENGKITRDTQKVKELVSKGAKLSDVLGELTPPDLAAAMKNLRAESE